ncbi:MAG TPA: gluconeogenesis factor YvcK family protein [Candidatus Saccharimonadales bacterium]|nr:gluconeogenesis factor YvcK family protein [Candidatus Saccharimonadales bacterium]
MTGVNGDKAPNIALIGGGTGSFTLLQELKDITPNISAIVNMSDDGGSTGVLRDELGVLPPGDVRQCLVALSDSPVAREIFNYRFGGKSRFSGHTIGNLILAGLELKDGSFDQALKDASSLLQITGQVIPVTLEQHVLTMLDGDELIKGEHKIGHRPINSQGAKVSLEPYAKLNPEAKSAIRDADLVMIAPGNLYGSILPSLAVDGMREAFEKSKAKRVMISNLVTKPGQTTDWHVVDYAKTIEQYIGEDSLDYVLYNQDLPSSELLEKYAAEGEFPVRTEPERFSEISAQAIGANLVASNFAHQDENDKAIRRTLIRHDAHQVGRQLMGILYQ